jgi:pimeloyl-ACP methyl ester carboxylesterase
VSTWILLRGLTRERRHWGGFPERLMAALPEARVVALELPGNGVLNELDSPVEIKKMAAQCHAEAARLRLAPPFHLLAMSMGAMVATAWAADHPEEIRACVLINTSFGAFSPLHQRLRPRAWLPLLGLLCARTDRQREQAILQLTSRLQPEAARVLDTWTAIRASRPVRAMNALRQMVAAARFRAPLAAPVPVLILASAADGLVDPRCSMEIARRWGCALQIHPEAGHDLPLDDGAWVAEQVRAWLAEADDGRARFWKDGPGGPP